MATLKPLKRFRWITVSMGIFTACVLILHLKRTRLESQADRIAFAAVEAPEHEYFASTNLNQSTTSIDLAPELEPQTPPTFVLLVTYLRSGSTWLGDLTKQGQGTVYVYEPFKPVLSRAYFTVGRVCWNVFAKCRDIKSETESYEFILRTLRDIYACRLDSLHPGIRNAVARSRSFGSLLNTSKESACSGNTTPCHADLIRLCQSASHIVIKVIRLSLPLVRRLMRDIPHLKVVHLVRDPRGIIRSRIKTKLASVAGIADHSKSLCSRMQADIEAKTRIAELYPGQVTTVVYEAMAEQPLKTAERVFDFLDIPYNSSLQRWINEHSYGNSSNGNYNTVRTNSTETAYAWRQALTYTDVHKIDEECSTVYAQLGYLPIEGPGHLKDMSIRSRREIDFGGFV